MNRLYFEVAGITRLQSLTISSSHNSTTAIATIESPDNGLDLGDHTTINMGYATNHVLLFQGYVKSKALKVPENTYTYTLSDDLIRAVDFFIVSDTPDSPLTYDHKSAENLVQTLLGLAGLPLFSSGVSSFTFGVNHPFEINLVNTFDYCHTIADLLTWHIWCDKNGVIQFRNRKGYPMLGGAESSQPGYETDSISSYVWHDYLTIDTSRQKDERNLRNRVVVYGNNVHASAQDESTPFMKWKTAILADSQLIENQGYAQNIADYNLLLLNRITDTITTTVVGDPSLSLYDVINVNSTKLGISTTPYLVTTCEHRLSREGYTTNLVLNK